jgi:hypothetical protein
MRPVLAVTIAFAVFSLAPAVHAQEKPADPPAARPQTDDLPGRLRVVTEPTGAQVRRAGEQTVLGQTPLELELLPGRHRFEVVAEGHDPQLFEIDMFSGVQRVVRVILAEDHAGAAATTAHAGGTSQIHVRTNVADALVMIDGVLVGTTDGARKSLSYGIDTGVHDVVVAKPGYRTWGARVMAHNGSGLDLDLRLGRQQPRGAKLAAWAIGGAGAASVLGGVGIGIGALLDEDEERAESADVMIIGGLAAIAVGGVVHWITRSHPPKVRLRPAD